MEDDLVTIKIYFAGYKLEKYMPYAQAKALQDAVKTWDGSPPGVGEYTIRNTPASKAPDYPMVIRYAMVAAVVIVDDPRLPGIR